MKIYISGKISGIETEAAKLFAAAEILLKSEGHHVVNPMQLLHMHNKSWASYMKEDIKAMCDCDGVYMLSNWRERRGSILEHTLAVNLGMVILHDYNEIARAYQLQKKNYTSKSWSHYLKK